MSRGNSLWEGDDFVREPGEEWPVRPPLSAEALAGRTAGLGLLAGVLILLTAANGFPLFVLGFVPVLGLPLLILLVILGSATLLCSAATLALGVNALRRSRAPWVLAGVLVGWGGMCASLVLVTTNAPPDWLWLL